MYAQKGIKIDLRKKEDVKKLRPSLPGRCSNDYVCLLLRIAAKNREFRLKKLKIEELYGSPVLFSDAQNKEKLEVDGLGQKPDSQIIKDVDLQLLAK